MKNILLSFILFFPCLLFAQLGVKAGYNYANITRADEVNGSARSGYHFGVFLGGSSKSIFTSRTELLYSRQGYNYNTDMNTGHVDLDYLMAAQLFAINITKLVQVQAGLQTSYLLNAKIDSTSSTGNQSVDKIIDLMNRFDYGIGGGVEVHPLPSLVAGVRLNLSFERLFKEPDPGEEIDFIPDINAKNNLFQIYVGMRFGKAED